MIWVVEGKCLGVRVVKYIQITAVLTGAPVNVPDNFMNCSINHWTKEWPTKENAGQWFFVKAFGTTSFQEIRVNETGEIYLCKECHTGLEKTSYGIPLSLYKHSTIEFCGPIQTPPDFRKS